jgi:hypothetical protein
LRGVVQNGAITLTWTNPVRRTDQSRVRDLMEARVYRSEDEGVMPPKPALLALGRIAGYQEIAVIRLGTPAPAVVQGNTVTFVDREGLRFGHRYTYVVLAEDSQRRVSPPSIRAAVMFIAPPEPPPPPQVEAGDRQARVLWQPPARLVDGHPAGTLAYEVSRSSAPDGPPDAVFAQPPGQTEFLDTGVENDRTYYYAVRAIRQDAGTAAVSEPSARVAATPHRTTPPTAPARLVATPSGRIVRLSWTPSADPNVGGYVVYRASGAGEFVRIGSTRIPSTTFIDREVPRGTYRYAVTAQDTTVRANESPRSNAVTVTVR